MTLYIKEGVRGTCFYCGKDIGYSYKTWNGERVCEDCFIDKVTKEAKERQAEAIGNNMFFTAM